MKVKMNIEKIISFIAIFSVIMGALVAEFGVPSTIFYINDALIIFVLIYTIKKGKIEIFSNIKFKAYIYLLYLFTFFVIVGVAINLVPINLIIWGIRNTYRGIIYFVFCVIYLKMSNIDKLFKNFYQLQFVNLLIGIYQFFVLGLRQDLVGGIFGHGNGNALNIFCGIITTFYLMKFLNKKEKIDKPIFCIGSSLILAAFAEEKFLFLEIIIILILGLVLAKNLGRKVLIISLGVLVLVGAFNIFQLYFPEAAETLLNFENILEYANASWEESYYFPRVGSFKIIADTLMNNNIVKILFGFGIGNCDTSSFEIFNSEFYQLYGHTHYRWFVHQWTFLELGIVGFVLFISLIISVIIYLIKNRNKIEYKYRYYVDTSIIVSIVCIITIWYNNTLKVDTSYIPYLAMSIGLIVIKDIKNILSENKDSIRRA